MSANQPDPNTLFLPDAESKLSCLIWLIAASPIAARRSHASEDGRSLRVWRVLPLQLCPIKRKTSVSPPLARPSNAPNSRPKLDNCSSAPDDRQRFLKLRASFHQHEHRISFEDCRGNPTFRQLDGNCRRPCETFTADLKGWVGLTPRLCHDGAADDRDVRRRGQESTGSAGPELASHELPNRDMISIIVCTRVGNVTLWEYTAMSRRILFKSSSLKQW